jgi:hypothetical protein
MIYWFIGLNRAMTLRKAEYEILSVSRKPMSWYLHNIMYSLLQILENWTFPKISYSKISMTPSYVLPKLYGRTYFTFYEGKSESKVPFFICKWR